MKTIPLSASDIARFWPKIDKTEDCWIWTAALTRGYGVFKVRIDNKPYMKKAHRITYELLVGPIPEGHGLDHMCHREACVIPAHLRPVTQKQNMENRLTANAGSASGVRGVHWNASRQKWQVIVGHHGKHYRGGSFDDPALAGVAAKALRAKLFTHSDQEID